MAGGLSGRAIRVEGIVQGVGFRPFVRNLAGKLGLSGSVRNDAGGVSIRAFGSGDALRRFEESLRSAAPPLSAITALRVDDIAPEPVFGFVIATSEADGVRSVPVTPDAALCADCRSELLSEDDRRRGYAFISCTHCGPRYSIVRDVPFDRARTSMAGFALCEACRIEYEAPDDRRFHAQASCCADCGPRLRLLDGEGRALHGDPLALAQQQLTAGRILAVKGLGGFHLACDARSEQAVARLRRRKRREEKPLAVMARDLEVVRQLVVLPDYGSRLLESSQAPILIAPRRPDAGLASGVAPDSACLGVMLPYTPLHVLLLDGPLDCLVMTSGNLSDEPICIDNAEALERLHGIADAFLVHDRDIETRLDDSICLDTAERPTLLRRARGHVPRGIETGLEVDRILAFGPLLKNTPALGRGSEVFVGQHIGDLDSRLALDQFEEVRTNLQRLLGVEPVLAACDMHPDYPSTMLAEQSGLPLVRVQHHHAHLLALMAEKREYGRAIGVALDGLGHGDDGAIWGGEVLLFDPLGYERAFHLEYVPQPGGDQAAREPWRMALAYLHREGIDWRPFVRHELAPQLGALLDSELELPRTSSAGRLFDAVSSLCGLCQHSTYEAQAAMALEAAAEPTDEAYGFELREGEICTGALIRGVVEDLGRGVPVSHIAGRFHATVVSIIVAAAEALREREGLERVFLSGGAMANRMLVGQGRRRLEQNGFIVHTHALLPPNDGGVSVGQVIHAAARRGEHCV